MAAMEAAGPAARPLRRNPAFMRHILPKRSVVSLKVPTTAELGSKARRKFWRQAGRSRLFGSAMLPTRCSTSLACRCISSGAKAGTNRFYPTILLEVNNVNNSSLCSHLISQHGGKRTYMHHMGTENRRNDPDACINLCNFAYFTLLLPSCY